jgi:general secretion pathway protein G
MANKVNIAKRWLQFGVRDLFLLMAVAALGVGWWIDHRRMTRDMSINRLEAVKAKLETERYEQDVARKEGQIEALQERLEQEVAKTRNLGADLQQKEQGEVQETESAKLAKARHHLDSFRTILDAYLLDVGSYPTSEQGLESLRKPPADVSVTDEWEPGKWGGPYISTPMPLDPWGNPYQYEYSSGDKQPKIWSFGPDGKTETGDDMFADP